MPSRRDWSRRALSFVASLKNGMESFHHCPEGCTAVILDQRETLPMPSLTLRMARARTLGVLGAFSAFSARACASSIA